jgi:hypothetical protein
MTDYFAASDGTMVVQVPIGGVPTLYARTGDLFAWLCVASLAVVVALTMAISIGAAAPGKPAAAFTSHSSSWRPSSAASTSRTHPKRGGSS